MYIFTPFTLFTYLALPVPTSEKLSFYSLYLWACFLKIQVLCHLFFFFNNLTSKTETNILSESEIAQSCPSLCDPMDCSPPGSSVHWILQARILEWVAISFSRGSSQLRDRTQVSCIAGRRFTLWATREAPNILKPLNNCLSVSFLYIFILRIYYIYTVFHRLFTDGSVGKESACSAGRPRFDSCVG